MRILTVSLLACALLLAACKPTSFTAPPAGDAAPPQTAKPPKPNDNLNAVLWMQSSAEYGAVCETVYSAAAAQLDAALAMNQRLRQQLEEIDGRGADATAVEIPPHY